MTDGLRGQWLEEQEKVGTITIATNGTVRVSEPIMELMENNPDIFVRISDYKLSNAPLELKEQMDKRNIINFFYEFAGNKGEWKDLGGLDIVTVSKKVGKEHFNTCAFRDCLTLENCELTYCSRASNSYRLQNYIRKKDDYLEIIREDNFKQKLEKFIRCPHYMEACRYCNGSEYGKIIIPAEQEGCDGK